MRKQRIKVILLMATGMILIAGLQVNAQHYNIDLTNPDQPVKSGKLQLGGENFLGRSISFNSHYMSMDGKPFIPVTGEFHYSRYPNEYWDESIKKMKAGGINVISTYVFWIIHEEHEGVFNWKGDNNLRKFIELCAANKVDVIVRIGPFCHGEIRNGGLPDWLLGKPLSIRSNDPAYLHYVERFYQQIGQQIKGLLFSDGGPVIGIQIENEYQHSAAPWGLTYPGQPHDWTTAERDRAATQAGVGVASEENPYAALGNEHMHILKQLAIRAGMKVPIYTATGWGNAAVIENASLPVASAYPYPTWADKSLSPLYLYRNLQQTPDYAPVRYNPEDYPYIAAEIGGGIMDRYNRRPVVPAKSLDALINRFLGSGANGIGYYMYHGGSTPKGDEFFFNDEAYGYTKISYDFQAPVGEYGQIRPSCNRLKLLHYFIQAFGEQLAPEQVVLPPQNVTDPDNLDLLRYSVRKKGDAGFIFMNNFQDHAQNHDLKDISLTLQTSTGEIRIPETGEFTLAKDENIIFPFNFNLNGVNLVWATAQPLSRFTNGAVTYYVFFTLEEITPQFAFDKQKGVTIRKENCSLAENKIRQLITCESNEPAEFTIEMGNQITKVLVINKKMALKAWLTHTGKQQKMIFTSADLLEENGFLKVLNTNNPEADLRIYPAGNYMVSGNGSNLVKLNDGSKLFSGYKISFDPFTPEVETENVNDNKFAVKLPDSIPAHVDNILLDIDYTGDTGMGFLKGKLVADNFYNGMTWEIGLRQFMQNPGKQKMIFYFRPIYQDATYLQDLPDDKIPEFEWEKYLKINKMKFVPVYSILLEIKQK